MLEGRVTADLWLMLSYLLEKSKVTWTVTWCFNVGFTSSEDT